MVGEGSRCSGLDAALAATFQVPVNLINPFHQIATNAKQENEIIKDKGHHFGVAVGLGLRHMGDAKG
jgi:Tfp pilus assembly PilM family ATPase